MESVFDNSEILSALEEREKALLSALDIVRQAKDALAFPAKNVKKMDEIIQRRVLWPAPTDEYEQIFFGPRRRLCDEMVLFIHDHLIREKDYENRIIVDHFSPEYKYESILYMIHHMDHKGIIRRDSRGRYFLIPADAKFPEIITAKLPGILGGNIANSLVMAADPMPESSPREKNPDAVALGRLGGSKGGKARAKNLSPERRREIAREAAKSRWENEPVPIVEATSDETKEPIDGTIEDISETNQAINGTMTEEKQQDADQSSIGLDYAKDEPERGYQTEEERESTMTAAQFYSKIGMKRIIRISDFTEVGQVEFYNRFKYIEGELQALLSGKNAFYKLSA